jgi:hypothetical protein
MTPRTVLGFRVSTHHASALGWLRRPELDEPNVEVWERPDGGLHAHDPRDGALILELVEAP